jgi:hypothetical protein
VSTRDWIILIVVIGFVIAGFIGPFIGDDRHKK